MIGGWGGGTIQPTIPLRARKGRCLGQLRTELEQILAKSQNPKSAGILVILAAGLPGTGPGPEYVLIVNQTEQKRDIKMDTMTRKRQVKLERGLAG